jgi:hypothetical protein
MQGIVGWQQQGESEHAQLSLLYDATELGDVTVHRRRGSGKLAKADLMSDILEP